VEVYLGKQILNSYISLKVLKTYWVPMFVRVYLSSPVSCNTWQF